MPTRASIRNTRKREQYLRESLAAALNDVRWRDDVLADLRAQKSALIQAHTTQLAAITHQRDEERSVCDAVTRKLAEAERRAAVYLRILERLL